MSPRVDPVSSRKRGQPTVFPALAAQEQIRLGRHWRALVVTGDASVRRITQDRLAAAGYRTIATDDGLHALMLAVRIRPAVIVLSDPIGGLDAYQVRRALQSDPRTARIPTILLACWDVARLVLPHAAQRGAEVM